MIHTNNLVYDSAFKLKVYVGLYVCCYIVWFVYSYMHFYLYALYRALKPQYKVNIRLIIINNSECTYNVSESEWLIFA